MGVKQHSAVTSDPIIPVLRWLKFLKIFDVQISFRKMNFALRVFAHEMTDAMLAIHIVGGERQTK